MNKLRLRSISLSLIQIFLPCRLTLNHHLLQNRFSFDLESTTAAKADQVKQLEYDFVTEHFSSVELLPDEPLEAKQELAESKDSGLEPVDSIQLSEGSRQLSEYSGHLLEDSIDQHDLTDAIARSTIPTARSAI